MGRMSQEELNKFIKDLRIMFKSMEQSEVQQVANITNSGGTPPTPQNTKKA